MDDGPLLLFEAEAEAAGFEGNADCADFTVWPLLPYRFAHLRFGIALSRTDLEEGGAVEMRVAAEFDLQLQRPLEVGHEAAPTLRRASFQPAR